VTNLSGGTGKPNVHECSYDLELIAPHAESVNSDSIFPALVGCHRFVFSMRDVGKNSLSNRLDIAADFQRRQFFH
jgi:hypothetical protein